MKTIPMPLKVEQNKIWCLDQRILPNREEYLEMKSLEDCHRYIESMVVRGAPLIGFSALWGMVIWLKKSLSEKREDFEKACDWLVTARPTAVNLAYELESAKAFLAQLFDQKATNSELVAALEHFTVSRMDKLDSDNRKMARDAYEELLRVTNKKDDFTLMTICNTGFLACGTTGTALGVISTLQEQQLLNRVYACETRPYLQGARLTTYELDKLGVDHRLIVEGAVSYVLEHEKIDGIFVGADRIVSNGDTANKIGTSNLAIIANHYEIPFYVVAPISSFDVSLANGSEINIEMRPEEEITTWKGERTCAQSTKGYNPSFDVTKGELITGIFCENGMIRPKEGKKQLIETVTKGLSK